MKELDSLLTRIDVSLVVQFSRCKPVAFFGPHPRQPFLQRLFQYTTHPLPLARPYFFPVWLPVYNGADVIFRYLPACGCASFKSSRQILFIARLWRQVKQGQKIFFTLLNPQLCTGFPASIRPRTTETALAGSGRVSTTFSRRARFPHIRANGPAVLSIHLPTRVACVIS